MGGDQLKVSLVLRWEREAVKQFLSSSFLAFSSNFFSL